MDTYIAEIRVGFIKKEELPIVAKIAKVELVEGKFKDKKTGEPKMDLRLTLENAGGQRLFDVWGANHNFLVYHLGPKPVNWVGKSIKIELQGVNKVVTSYEVV